MYLVDITADLNDEDETGYVWTFLDEAREPGQIVPGVLVVYPMMRPAACLEHGAECVDDGAEGVRGRL